MPYVKLVFDFSEGIMFSYEANISIYPIVLLYITWNLKNSIILFQLARKSRSHFSRWISSCISSFQHFNQKSFRGRGIPEMIFEYINRNENDVISQLYSSNWLNTAHFKVTWQMETEIMMHGIIHGRSHPWSFFCPLPFSHVTQYDFTKI